MKKVLIPEDIASPGKDYLKERGYSLTIGVPTDVESLKKEIADADGIIVRNALYPKEVLEAGKKLKVVGRHGTGTDNIAVKEAEEMGIWVVNGPTANVNTVAEYTIAMVLALNCRVVYLDKYTRKGDWSRRLQLKRCDVMDKTVGIVGFGRIGQLVAEKVTKGLGMKVIAYDPLSFDMPEVQITQNLDELLKESDFVTAHLPSTTQTKNMFDYNAFCKMKPEAFFINCARGDTYIEADLVKAIKEGKIAGAGIDVYEKEPICASPLFDLEEVIVSQHNAGLSKEANDKMSLHAAIGVHEILEGNAPTWPVNLPTSPRK